MPLQIAHINPAILAKGRGELQASFSRDIQQTEKLFKSLGIDGIANTWLRDMAWKRDLTALIFGDLIFAENRERRSILEIGGSLSAITLKMLERFDYNLIEKATHETEDEYRNLEAHLGTQFVVIDDWSKYSLQKFYDIIIANDIFPNVDMRLYEFIERYLPYAQELRITLTYYENTIFEVQRIGSGEQLTILPWNLDDIVRFFQWFFSKYPDLCNNIAFEEATKQMRYEDYQGTIFGNRRNIIYCRISR